MHYCRLLFTVHIVYMLPALQPNLTTLYINHFVESMYYGGSRYTRAHWGQCRAATLQLLLVRCDYQCLKVGHRHE
eukprot:scaffold98911_cov31-Prasinocladus_malaysianus.AAC.1